MRSKQLALPIQERPINLPFPLPVHIALKGLAQNIRWPDLSQNLVEVACAIFLADRLIRRPRGTLGPRQIDLKLPVRQPQVWNRVAPHLQEILAILGGDTFSFDFYGSRKDTSCFPQTAGHQQRMSVDRVVLFSGGLDSAAAAATFAEEGVQAAYVTHYVTGIRRIEKLLKDIYETYDTKSPTQHAQFYIRPVGPIVRRLKENSRRTRSFLFASLALATAIGVEAHEVCICENGPLAINLPLTPAMVPTRHAHSQFLRAMERLSKELFGVPIRVLNPFELATKGEMSRVFVPHPELALETVSCWNQQWSGRGKNYGKGHCGYCLPCLVRLASLESAGIVIPKGHFDSDVRRLARRLHLSQKELHRLGSYKALLSFTAKLQSCQSWREFIPRFPDVIDTEPTYRPLSLNEWFKNVFGMVKRFADEVDQTFGKG